jgi:hypothetical protein
LYPFLENSTTGNAIPWYLEMVKFRDTCGISFTRSSIVAAFTLQIVEKAKYKHTYGLLDILIENQIIETFPNSIK